MHRLLRRLSQRLSQRHPPRLSQRLSQRLLPRLLQVYTGLHYGLHRFTLDNRGKQSIAVNLADPDGQQIVRDLAAKADVFLTNLLPVRLGRFGLDYPTIDASNPRIVYASVSGWGLSGPDPDRLAFDMTAFFARGGIMSMWGQPGDPPVKPRSGQGDHQTGLAAFSAILAALLLRVSSAPSCAESPHPPSLLCLLAAR